MRLYALSDLHVGFAVNRAALADIAASRDLPCALVDLAAFDRNCAHVARLAATKRVRIATKSIRVAALIERVLKRGAHHVPDAAP